MSYEDIATLGFKADTSDLAKAADALDKMADSAAKAESAAKKTESSLKSSSSATDKLTKDTLELATAIKSAAAAFAAWQITQVAESALLAAARFQTLGVVMEVAGRNAGYTASQMHSFERSLAAQGITMTESRETLTRLAAAHINLAESSKIARAAQDLAVVGGINSSEAFARMVQGIQKAETEIMRSLGLNIQWEQGYDKLAKTLGTTASALTEQQKIQARVNQTMEAAAAYADIYASSMETAGKQLTSMPRYLQNLTVLIGGIGLPAFSSSIMATTEKLKSMEQTMQSLTDDGTVARWGVGLDSALKTIASGADNAAVAIGLYLVATKSAAAYSLLMESAVVQSAASMYKAGGATAVLTAGVKGLNSAMIALAKNPIFWIVAVGSALYALWENMEQGNKEIADLKKSFGELSGGMEGAAESATRFKDAQQALTIALTKRAVDDAEQKVAKYGKQLKDMAASFKDSMPDRKSSLEGQFVGLEYTPYEEVPKEVLDAVDEYNQGLRDEENLLVTLLDLKRQGIVVNGTATDRLIDLTTAYLASNDQLDKQLYKLQSVTAATESFGEAQAEAARKQADWRTALDSINKGLDKYYESMKKPASVEEATVFLLKYTGQSKLAEEAQKELAKAQALAAIAAMQQAASIALVNNDLEKCLEILAVIENFKQYLNADGSIISPKSGAGSASAINKVTEATLKLNEELSKVKGTNAITAYDEIAKKIHDLEKDLGKTTPQVKELNQLLVQKADYDLLQDILKHTDPVAAGIASVSKEYQELLKNIDAAHSKGLISDDEAASMAKKAEGWKKAQEIDQQNSLLTQQLDLVQKIVDLGGSSTLSVKLQTQQIDAMAEKIRALFPEVSSLVDEWQKLAKKEINSPEAAIKRQIDALHKQRDAWSGVEAAVLQYNLDATNYCQQTENIFKKVMDGMTDALTEFVMTGKLSFEDLANDFIRQIIRMQMQAMVSGLFSGITSIVGGGLGASSGSSTPASGVEEVYIPDAMSVAPLHHDGGLAGYVASASRSVSADMFRNAPKFHTGGGLMPDEYPAILQKGEYVLNQSDTKAYLAGRMAVERIPQISGIPQAYMAQQSPVTNNINITPPDGYEAHEQRSKNSSGGDDLRVTFSRMMAAEVGAYGSPVNSALRKQGMRTPVVRQG